MEKRLESFITSVQNLADIRNLDVFNPVVFQMEHPITGTRYTVVGAKLEPSYLGIPLNTTWVVLDPSDDYYLQALCLREFEDVNVTTKPATPGGAKWHLARSYDELFALPQTYNQTGVVGPQGEQGIAGPVGPTGEKGELGPVGPTGEQGPAGVGSIGPQGIQGPTGATGPAGLNGQQGPQGIQGIQGLRGIQGEVGPVGPTGVGLKGDTGPVGPTGATGPQGMGIVGEQGPVGPTGIQGPVGPTGAQGIQGVAGPVGPTGPLGFTPGGVDGLTVFTSSVGAFRYQELLTRAYVVDNDTELGAAKTLETSLADIFNNWTRFSHSTTGVQPASASELSAWSYDSVAGVLSCTVNSGTYIGFVSSEKYSSYMHSVTLAAGTNADDDSIAVVIAYAIDAQGVQHTLSAIRDAGGMLASGFAIVYDYRQTTSWVVAAPAAGTMTTYKTPLSGWANMSADVQVLRSNNNVSVSTSQMYATAGVSPGLTVTLDVDLKSDPRLALFIDASAYGYGSFSEIGATFTNIKFSARPVIYDARNGDKWTLNLAEGNYSVSGSEAPSDIGVGRFVLSQNATGDKLYYLTAAGLLVRLMRQPKTVKLFAQTLAASAHIDLDPRLLFEDSTLLPSNVDVIVGVAQTSGLLSGFNQTQNHLLNVGYNDTVIRIVNASSGSLSFAVTLNRQ